MADACSGSGMVLRAMFVLAALAMAVEVAVAALNGLKIHLCLLAIFRIFFLNS